MLLILAVGAGYLIAYLLMARAFNAALGINDSDRLEAVAEAIARAAGHNWHADMMPQYRAEFRRQAAAAIDALKRAHGGTEQ